MLYNYLRFCRFYLEQSYDITKARNNESETLSDVYGELEFKLNRYLSFNADAEYDTYDTPFFIPQCGHNPDRPGAVIDYSWNIVTKQRQ